jgi:hypothetical protein
MEEELFAIFQNQNSGLGANDKSTWKKAIEYSKSPGIPEEQLDFATE